ncbi:MAG TPA: PHB depolymerase family esterase [Burkholderiaceae bacterium]|nr:PHB depolymerase family esterase [Burkholderiaceae bacterium]
MMSSFLRAAGGAAAWLWAFGSWAAPLPQLAADPAQVSVSGLSSGGFMAVQMHVAYSGTFTRGAGVVAGGPFYCAEGSIVNATGRCMNHSNSIPVDRLVATTRTWAASGRIDPVANLAGSRVYLFSGTQDGTVKPAVMDDLRTYYRSFVPDAAVVYKNDLAAAHAMVTDDYGNGCTTSFSPYINNCGFDLAGAMLAQLHGPLNPRNNGSLSGSFIEFDQTAFVSGHGMGATGWAYVPQACRSGSVRCKVHVVFHGCQQNATLVGDKYVRNTGYNRWADTNQMVVLYPQTSTQATNSCWDWWGYDSADYAAKSGPQMAAVKAMVDRLTSGSTGPAPTLPAPTGLGTSGATAGSMVLAWNSVSGASGYNLYRSGSKVNASLINGNTFTDTGLAPSTTYSWTVTAVDASGGESEASAPASGTTASDGVGQPPSGSCTTASNFAHTLAGRARVIWGQTYANGSNQAMGLWNVFVTTTLKQTGPDYYVIGTCP